MSRMTLDAVTIRRVAEITNVDKRSVRAVAAGKYVRGRAGERIRIALRVLGIAPPPSANPPKSAT